MAVLVRTTQTEERSLSELSPGLAGVIERLVDDADLPASYLAALGFIPGRHLTVLQRLRGGAILVQVNGSKYALGTEVSRRIVVRG